jgi:hypothetical protein
MLDTAEQGHAAVATAVASVQSSRCSPSKPTLSVPAYRASSRQKSVSRQEQDTDVSDASGELITHLIL